MVMGSLLLMTIKLLFCVDESDAIVMKVDGSKVLSSEGDCCRVVDMRIGQMDASDRGTDVKCRVNANRW